MAFFVLAPRAPAAAVARVVLSLFEQTLRRLASCSVAAQASVSCSLGLI